MHILRLIGVLVILILVSGCDNCDSVHLEYRLSTIYIGEHNDVVVKTTQDTYDQNSPRRGDTIIPASMVPSASMIGRDVRISATDFGAITFVAMKQAIRDALGGGNLDEMKVFVRGVGGQPSLDASFTAGISSDPALAVVQDKLYLVWVTRRELHVYGRQDSGSWREFPIIQLTNFGIRDGFDAIGYNDKLVVAGQDETGWSVELFEISISGNTLTETAHKTLDPLQQVHDRVSLATDGEILSVACRVDLGLGRTDIRVWHLDRSLATIGGGSDGQVASDDPGARNPAIAWVNGNLWMCYAVGEEFRLMRLPHDQLSVRSWMSISPTWKLNDYFEQTTYQMDLFRDVVIVGS